MTPRLIALTGRAGSGKSTVAEYLSRNFGYRRTRFAGPLKDMLRALYASSGMEPDEIERRIEGDLKETHDPLLCGQTPRHAMQTLGTEWRELIGRELWSNMWRASVENGHSTVEDCRFEHEYAAVKELGGIVVQIDRHGTGPELSHASEAGLPAHCPPDFVIDNSGSMDELKVQVGRMLYLLDSEAA